MRFRLVEEQLQLNSLKRIPMTDKLIQEYSNSTKFLSVAPKDEFGSMWFDNEDLVGYCMANDYGWLTALEVMPKYQHQGIGEQILDYAIENYGINRLGVKEDNANAIKLYQKKGFIEVPSEIVQGSGERDMIFMLLETLEEDFTDYNANPHGKNEDDCTIRALSLAYDMRYNTVKGELNSIAGHNKSKFNYIDTVNAFIEKHGYRNYTNNEDGSGSIGTVEGFANKHRHGVFVIHCSNKTKQDSSNSFHLVAVINGKIYDTWDSSNYYVLGAWDIKSHNRTVNGIGEK